VDTLIGTATTTFEATTGFPVSDVVTFTGDNLGLVIGSGLGLFQALLPWIIALVVLGAIVYFVYRAFRLFRH